MFKKNPFQDKIHAFFARRSPRQDRVSLGLHNVYIFSSRVGLLFVLLLIATFITGINYGNNLVLGLCFYLFGIWLVSVFYTFVQISSLDIRLVETELMEAESVGYVTLELSSRSAKPSRQVVLRFDGWKKTENTKRQVIIPVVNGSMLVKVPVYAPHRGVMSLPRLVVGSSYPLGIMRAWSYVYLASLMCVYPKPISFDWQGIRQTVDSDGDEQSAMSRVGQDDFDMLDEYQQGESLARVSWAHTARGMGMLTKHFGDTGGREWCLRYEDMPSATHESKLGELSHAVQSMSGLGVPFMLLLPSDHGDIGVGDDFVRQCLIRLAKEP